MSAAEQESLPELERVPFTPNVRRKVRRRLRAFWFGIGLVVILLASFQVMLSFGDLSSAATLLFRLFFVVLGLALIALIAYRARLELRDLRLGYALRYEGPVALSFFHPSAGNGSPQFYVKFPGQFLGTTRAPFVAIGRRPDFVPALPYTATVEFTPLAGDVLALITAEYGEVRA